MKHQLKELHLNQSIFSIAIFLNGIREARTVTCWHFVCHKNEKKKKKKVVCAAQSWYGSHWGLWMCVKRIREHKQDEFGVFRAATRTWKRWGKRWEAQVGSQEDIRRHKKLPFCHIQHHLRFSYEGEMSHNATECPGEGDEEGNQPFGECTPAVGSWAGCDTAEPQGSGMSWGDACGPWAVTGHGEGPKSLWAM